MTMTLPYRRQQVTPRSGGRIAGDRRAAEREYGVVVDPVTFAVDADATARRREAVA